MTKNLSAVETAARAELVSIASYRVEVDIREASQMAATFPVTSTLALTLRRPGSTWIDFLGHAVHGVIIDGEETEPVWDGARITLPELTAGEHTVEIRAEGVYSHTGEGLHQFKDPVDGRIYLYTQFEPADARRLFPNCEQPDLKSIFTFVVKAPASWHVLSNRPAASRVACEPNSVGEPCEVTEFEPTLRQSTYITALCAGEYAEFTSRFEGEDHEGRSVVIPLAYYCRQSLAQYFDVDDVDTVTRQGLALFPKAYKMAYPWGEYKSVFVPEYNLGAMENPGCVTFNERMISRGQATRAEKAGRANTILHEMSHMWFGDLVTMKWWNDLWLKESFADFMGTWASAKGTKYTEAWAAFAGNRASWAYQADSMPSTHPIAATIDNLEAADQNFDGITYAKGAAVLRQLVAYVGEDRFFDGAARYFAEFAYGNTELPDLLRHLQEASGRDLTSWAKLWLETPGPTWISATRTADGVELTQTLSHIEGSALRPHRLSVAAYVMEECGCEGSCDVPDGAPDGARLVEVGRTSVELLDHCTIPWSAFGDAAEAAAREGTIAAIVPNAGAETYALIEFDGESLEALLAHDMDEALVRGVVWTALWHSVIHGKLAPNRYIDAVLARPTDTDSALLASRTVKAVDAACRLIEPTRFPEIWSQVKAHIDAADPSSDTYMTWLRMGAAIVRCDPSLASEARAMVDAVSDDDERWEYIVAAAATGALTAAEIDAYFEASHKAASDVLACAKAKASLPTREVKLAAWTEMMEGSAAGTMSNDHVQARITGIMQPASSACATGLLATFFTDIDRWWADYSQEIAQRLVRGLFPPARGEDGEAVVDAARAWLADGDHPAALRRVIVERLYDAECALRLQKM